ncbi:uncharacterized protein LOC132400448 isoform X3 [Hypanus sabinus]|uniref:uncharacterized protein LOC132400448 isoform X3 n=1 Tax=Hypanus sabinus TaxID=79690 RepID=UPI0028C39313|nr:uncharacterized protein LOC132400448 isoform X3 [Hypanus sabinus]
MCDWQPGIYLYSPLRFCGASRGTVKMIRALAGQMKINSALCGQAPLVKSLRSLGKTFMPNSQVMTRRGIRTAEVLATQGIPGHRPSKFDRMILLWSGRFKKEEDIPATVSPSTSRFDVLVFRDAPLHTTVVTLLSYCHLPVRSSHSPLTSLVNSVLLPAEQPLTGYFSHHFL